MTPANAGCKVRAQQSRICGFIRKPPYGCQPDVNSPRRQAAIFEMKSITKTNAWLNDSRGAEQYQTTNSAIRMTIEPHDHANMDGLSVNQDWPVFPLIENQELRFGLDLAYAIDAGIVSSTSVPEPVLLHSLRFPPTSLALSCMPGKPQWPTRPLSTAICESMPMPSSRMRNRKRRES